MSPMFKPLARLLSLHWTLTLFLMGVFATFATWGSVEIFRLLRANLAFIAAHGALALMEGAAVQLVQLAAWGYASLVAYVLFKACERILVDKVTAK
jgi:hypothetical protein